MKCQFNVPMVMCLVKLPLEEQELYHLNTQKIRQHKIKCNLIAGKISASQVQRPTPIPSDVSKKNPRFHLGKADHFSIAKCVFFPLLDRDEYIVPDQKFNLSRGLTTSLCPCLFRRISLYSCHISVQAKDLEEPVTLKRQSWQLAHS